ncbi:MAG TPA: DUF4129 domain-containing protein [Ornithinicoccus sp.]|nr:DUF4129 domain-containing protein [Ornithinicoccus sp.]
MLDPDRDEARELLQGELQKPEYNQPESLLVKALNWLMDRLSDLINIMPGSTALSTVLLALVLGLVGLGVYFAVRGSRRSLRLTDRSGPVLSEAGLTAAAYRERAATASRDGRWDDVLLDSYRAIAAATDERALLDESPGTTAHEIAVGLRAPFPDHADAVLQAADAFDTVCYGGGHASREQAERVRDLDRTLARARPARVPVG